MPGVYLHTLGCKSNRYEEARMAEGFARYGLPRLETPADADVIVVNSCCVTVTAEGKSRRLVRRLKRDHPRALVVLAGCLASLLPDAADFADMTVPQERKASLPDMVAGGRLGLPEVASPPASAGPRTRALLKVQDGCERRCTYCIIPTLRGGEVSVPLPDLLRETATLAEAGHREIVLTGMVTGRYGDGGANLAGLIRAMLATPGFRIRISSIDVRDVSDELLDLVHGEPRVCPHLHIPLQAGSAAVLARMNRAYSPERFAERVTAFLARDRRATVTTDVICGFPGEREEDFRATLDLIGSLPVYDLHVFPFSPRPGTPAATMDDPVDEATKRDRVERLIEVKARKRAEHMARCVGMTAEVLVESSPPARGFTENYLEAELAGAALPPGTLARTRLASAGPERMAGEVIP